MNRKQKVLYSREDINQRVCELAKELEKKYKGKDLLVVSLLRGSFIFAADLIREMNLDMEVDFITTSSYENEESSSGRVEILHDLRANVEGRPVLIVDDIVDSGRTLEYVSRHIQEMGPSSLESVVLLDKPSRREVDFQVDHAGFTIEDVFIVGYGLNYGNYHRNVPYIFTYDDQE